MEYVPDNYDAFVEHDAEQQGWLATLPKCVECGDPIQDEVYYEIDNRCWCPSCMDDHRRMNNV